MRLAMVLWMGCRLAAGHRWRRMDEDERRFQTTLKGGPQAFSIFDIRETFSLKTSFTEAS